MPRPISGATYPNEVWCLDLMYLWVKTRWYFLSMHGSYPLSAVFLHLQRDLCFALRQDGAEAEWA